MYHIVKYIFFISFALVLSAAQWKVVLDDTHPFRRDTIVIQTQQGKKTLPVEVAEDPQQWERGLMYRQHLPQGHGMLFLFGKPSQVSMWMKDTYIPLAILYMDEYGVIVRIEPHAVPMSEKIIASGQRVIAALEINAADLETLGIHRGHRIEHEAFQSPNEEATQ